MDYVPEEHPLPFITNSANPLILVKTKVQLLRHQECRIHPTLMLGLLIYYKVKMGMSVSDVWHSIKHPHATCDESSPQSQRPIGKCGLPAEQ